MAEAVLSVDYDDLHGNFLCVQCAVCICFSVTGLVHKFPMIAKQLWKLL